MTSLSAGLDAELAKSSVLDFHAVEILLPGYALRLIDGAGFVDFGGHRFTGRDATYGTLGEIQSYQDGGDGRSPRLILTLNPPTTTSAAVLANPAAQRSQVSLWYGALNPLTGLPVDVPSLEFLGALDLPILKVGLTRTLELEVASALDALMPRDDGVRLNNSFHTSIWPGERGFEYVSDVQRQLPWGQDAPRPVVITDVRSTGGGLFSDAANLFNL